MEQDDINSPAHYTTLKDALNIEVIDLIEAMDWGYHLGNVVKYLFRHEYKGDPLKDLRKARWYLDRAIEFEEEEEREAAELAEYMNDPAVVAVREKIRVAVLDVLKDDGYAEKPGFIFASEEHARDAYGRVLRASPPVNIDGDTLEECDRCGVTLDPDDAEDTYVDLPFNGRVAGQGSPDFYDKFYDYDRNELLEACGNDCGEVVRRGDLHLLHDGKRFCSTVCVDGYKEWRAKR